MIIVDSDGHRIHRGMQVDLMTKGTVKHLYPNETSMDLEEYLDHSVRTIFEFYEKEHWPVDKRLNEDALRLSYQFRWKFVEMLLNEVKE